MSWLKHIVSYGWFDLFSKINRGSTFIILGQVALLILICSILVTFSGSFRHFMYSQINDPLINRLNIWPDLLNKQTGITDNDFKKMQSFSWTTVPGKGKAIYPEDEINKNGWSISGKAISQITGHHPLSCTVDKDGVPLQFDVITVNKDDPFIQKLGYKSIFHGNNINSIVITDKVAKDSGILNLEKGSTFNCMNLNNEPFKIIAVDQGSKFPLNVRAFISEEWYKLYYSSYHGGLKHPSYSSVYIYPYYIEDVIPLAEAVSRLGYVYDKYIFTKVENSMITSKFINIIIVGFLFILALTIFQSIFFNLLYVLSKKKKEIGYVKANGMSNRTLISIYIFEGFIINAIGITAGVIIFWLSCPHLEIFFQSQLSRLLKVEVLMKYSPEFALQYIIIAITIIFIAIILVTFISVIMITKRKPAELLRE